MVCTLCRQEGHNKRSCSSNPLRHFDDHCYHSKKLVDRQLGTDQGETNVQLQSTRSPILLKDQHNIQRYGEYSKLSARKINTTTRNFGEVLENGNDGKEAMVLTLRSWGVEFFKCALLIGLFFSIFLPFQYFVMDPLRHHNTHLKLDPSQHIMQNMCPSGVMDCNRE